MDYLEQLQQSEWKQKRLQILKRDNNTCQSCSTCITDIHPDIHSKDIPIAVASFTDFLEKMNVEVLEVENDKFTLKYLESKKDSINATFHWFIEFFNKRVVRNFHPLYSQPHYLVDNKVAYYHDSLDNLNEPLGIGLFYEKDSAKGEGDLKTRSLARIMASQIEKGKTVFKLFPMSMYEKYKLTTEKFSLHVHHNYYIKNTLAWQYLDTALTTLCHICHKKFHEENDVYVYMNQLQAQNKEKGEVVELCYKCDGSGYLPEFHYKDNGICYACGGEGVIINV
jgi:5-methylcytosine-specific restriction endonuclease McrA